MIFWRHFLLLFGGFHDTSSITKYHNDLWVFDSVEEKWTEVKPPGTRPEARSGFTLLPSMDGGVVIGGYAKVKGNTGKLRGIIYNGLSSLNMLTYEISGPSRCLLIPRRSGGNEDGKHHLHHRIFLVRQ